MSLKSDAYVLGHANHHYIKTKNVRGLADFAVLEAKRLRSALAKLSGMYVLLLVSFTCLVCFGLINSAQSVKYPILHYSILGIISFAGFVFLPRLAIRISRMFELLILWNQIGYGDLSWYAIEKTLEQIFEIIRTTWSRHEN